MHILIIVIIKFTFMKMKEIEYCYIRYVCNCPTRIKTQSIVTLKIKLPNNRIYCSLVERRKKIIENQTFG